MYTECIINRWPDGTITFTPGEDEQEFSDMVLDTADPAVCERSADKIVIHAANGTFTYQVIGHEETPRQVTRARLVAQT
jgi:hypothetical protein